MTRAPLYWALLLASCSWSQRPLPPPAEVRALEIAGAVYGADLRAWRVVYLAPDCVTDALRPAYLTAKKNCVVGAIAPYVAQINVGWIQGETTYERSGFCAGAQQAAEAMRRGGYPEIYCAPERCAERERERERCEAAMKGIGP